MTDKVYVVTVRDKIVAVYASLSNAEAEAGRLRNSDKSLAVQPRMLKISAHIVR